MSRTHWRRVVWGVALVLIGGMGWMADCLAQEGKSKVVIKQIVVDKRKTPSFNGAFSFPGARVYQDWIQILCEYQTTNGQGRGADGKLGWHDDVTIEWSVLLRRKDLKDILLHRSVTYVDVEDKRATHYADIYLRPGFVARYAKDVTPRDIYVYAQIKVNGQTEARKRLDRNDDAKWFDWETPKVIVNNNEILTRDETPFAPLDYDLYEQIKKATRE